MPAPGAAFSCLALACSVSRLSSPDTAAPATTSGAVGDAADGNAAAATDTTHPSTLTSAIGGPTGRNTGQQQVLVGQAGTRDITAWITSVGRALAARSVRTS